MKQKNSHIDSLVKTEQLEPDDTIAIKLYIEQHGFGIPAPTLTNSLPANIFKQHYYNKKALINFCRLNGVSTSGQKNELNARIELFLLTGQITAAQPTKPSAKPDSQTGLSLKKVVIHYKSDPETRRFFEQNCPGFTGFSALVQKQIKARLSQGDIFTYNDIIKMHQSYLQNKRMAIKTGAAITVAHASCEFNQFYIDYKHDDCYKIHTAKDAWILVRNTAGEKTYQQYKNRIEEIRCILKQPF